MADYPDWTRLFQLAGTEITIPINIEASDINVPISIDAATTTVPVGIVAQTINVSVEISASTVTLDVNIAAQDANIDINFNDQAVAVFDAAKWFAHQAEEISAGGSVTVPDATGASLLLRTVPTGKRFFVTGFGWSQHAAGTPNYLEGRLRFDAVVKIGAGSYRGGGIILDTPMRATAGQAVYLELYHHGSGGSLLCFGAVWGYDEDV